MKNFKGSALEIILSLIEGDDFGFINTKFRIIASFNNSIIKTNQFDGDKTVKFNSDLVWASDKVNIKKVRDYKVPIRLDFFKVTDDSAHAKPFGYVIISIKTARFALGNDAGIKEERVKVCGLGKEARNCSPEITFCLRIQDALSNDLVSARESDSKSEVTAKTSDSLPIIPNTKYFSIDPTEKDDVKQLRACSKYQLDINFSKIKWMFHYKNIHLRLHNSKAEVWWSAHEEISETIPGTCTNVDNVSGRLIFLALPSEVYDVISETPPSVTICTNRHGRPQVLAKALISRIVFNENVQGTADFCSITNGEKTAMLIYSAILTELGVHKYHEPAVVDQNVLAEKMKLELDAWKENERQKLEEKYETKLKEEILKMESMLPKREHDSKEDATDAVCQKLSDQLKKAITDVREKEKALEAAKIQLEAEYCKQSEETSSNIERLRKYYLDALEERETVICELRNELESLKIIIQDKENKEVLVADQLQSLLADLNKSEEQLERMKVTKCFFKEQWCRAIRELHRIKCVGWKDIQVQLNFRKEELQRLGLEQLLNDSDNYSDVNGE